MITIKTDPRVKHEAQKVARNLGFPLSTVINAYLRQFVREKRITFSMVEPMTKKLERAITRAERDIKTGKNISIGFRTAKEMDAYLESR